MKRIILVIEVLLMAIIPSVLFSLFAMIWLDTIFWLKIAGTLVLSYKVFDFILTLVETYVDRKKITKTTDDIMKAFESFKLTEEEKTWYEKEMDGIIKVKGEIASRELFARDFKINKSNPSNGNIKLEDVAEKYANKIDSGKEEQSSKKQKNMQELQTEMAQQMFEELYEEDVKGEPTLWDLAPSIIPMYIDIKNRLYVIDDKDCTEKQLKKKQSVLKQNEKNLDNFLKNLEKELSEEEYLEGMSPIARHKYEKEFKAKAKRPSAKVKSTNNTKNK